MGTNQLFLRSPGEVIRAAHVNDYFNALVGELVPRNASGIAQNNQGSLGNNDFRFDNAYINSSLFFEDQTTNATEIKYNVESDFLGLGPDEKFLDIFVDDELMLRHWRFGPWVWGLKPLRFGSTLAKGAIKAHPSINGLIMDINQSESLNFFQTQIIIDGGGVIPAFGLVHNSEAATFSFDQSLKSIRFGIDGTSTVGLLVKGAENAGSFILNQGDFSGADLQRFGFGIASTAGVYYSNSSNEIQFKASGKTGPFLTCTNGGSLIRFSDGDDKPIFSISGGNTTILDSTLDFAFVTVGSQVRSETIANDATGSSANVFISSSNGRLQRSTSSIKYKKDVEDADFDFSKSLIKKCRPVWYRSKCKSDRDDFSYWGFIAEEIATIDPRLVSWGHPRKEIKIEDVYYDEGKEKKRIRKKMVPDESKPMHPESVNYDRFVVHLVNVIKDLNKRIEALEADV